MLNHKVKSIQKLFLIFIFSVFSFGFFFSTPVVFAENTAAKCEPTSALSLSIPKPCEDYTCESGSTDCLKNNPITQWLIFFINLLASIIGVGAIIMIIFAGIQYTAARDNPQAIQAAKQKMVNVLIGLAAFVFMYSFLQWLVPGGAF